MRFFRYFLSPFPFPLFPARRAIQAPVLKQVAKKKDVFLEHRFSNQKPNPPAPFPTREGGAKLPSPRRGGVGGEVLLALLNWCSRYVVREIQRSYFKKEFLVRFVEC